jgi:predicted helicase
MAIKDRINLLAIIGNPPYFNGKSQTKKNVIDDELQVYKYGLNEQKINLDDEYIKFIRFAEWKINKCGQGVVGIITNNSFLDGVTHRQMRKHLYETFDEIYILNLHGNSRKGDADKNIFDIMLGVSISIFVKLSKPLKQKNIRYFSVQENGILKRAEKLSFLQNNFIKTVDWVELKPKKTPYFWFVPKDFSHEKEYEKFWKITEIFKVYGSGVKTNRDDLLVNYSKHKLAKNLETAFSFDFDKKFAEKFNIKNSTSYKFRDKLGINNLKSSILKR